MNNKAMSLKRGFGRIEQKKGKQAEQKVLEAINSFAGALSWFRSVRFATYHEDQRGIDLVLETNDLGILYLQVKSSRRLAQRYIELHPRMVVAIVIISVDEEMEIIWQKVLSKIIELRKEVNRRRNCFE